MLNLLPSPTSLSTRGGSGGTCRGRRHVMSGAAKREAAEGSGVLGLEQGTSTLTFKRTVHALLTIPRGPSLSMAAFKAGGGSVGTSTTTGAGGLSSAGGSQVNIAGAGSHLVASPRPPSGKAQGHRALVLDCSYRPINVVSWCRAVTWDICAKAAVLEYYPAPACAISGRGEHPLPAVLRVNSSINLTDRAMRVSCTRRNVLVRDKFACQYCGVQRNLTLDHVVPVSRGGKDTWTNLVTACTQCNQKKGNRLLHELKGWRLRTVPREPRPWELGMVVGLNCNDLEAAPEEWQPWIAAHRERLSMIQERLRATCSDSGRNADLDQDDGQKDDEEEAALSLRNERW